MGGGGGGGAPTQQTITQTNIPDWLRPQVETTLGGAMKQLFQTKETPGTYNPETGQTGPSTYEITGVSPFKPFQTSQEQLDVAKGAVAGLSPLQQQAMAGAAGLQMPGQFGMGTDLATTTGIGGLSAGAQYAGMATNPYAMQAFMSPYMQNVVDVQQREAQRQANIAQQAQQAQFARAGAFGGGRSGIQQAQAAADLARQKQTIQATGLQNAFQQAQQAQQFGANLGLQGLGVAGQMAGQLGQLGAGQLAAQQGIIGTQTQAGALQQQQEQNVINQAISNYAQAQQYPLQQYNAYNALLRGYAVPGQTATTYQAAPSLANQLGGLGTAAYGAYKMFGQKEGGPVKMATGGVASLNARVLEDPYEFSPEQIKRGVKNGLISDLIGVPALSQIEKFKQQAQAMQAAQQPEQPPIAETLLAEKGQGIPALPSNLSSEGYAGGGIVAFQTGGKSDEDFKMERDQQRQAEVQKMSPEQKLVYRVAAAMNPADPGKQLDPYKLAVDFASDDPDKKQRTLNAIFNSKDPKIIPLVAEYRSYIGSTQAGSTRAEAPVANAPEGSRSQREEQARKDRASLLLIPAVTADIMGLPANLALRAQDSVTSTINQVANAVGIPRLLRATGIAGPDFTEVNFPRIAPSSLIPVSRLLRRYEVGEPQGPSGEVLDAILASQGRSAPELQAGANTGANTGARTETGTNTETGTKTGADTDAKRISYDLLSRDFYKPGTPPAEISPTLMTGQAMLARSEADRKRRLEEAALANAPIYKILQEGVEKQEGRLAGMDERNKAMALIAMGLQMAQHRGPIGSAIGAGGIEGLSTYMKGDAAKRAAEEKLDDARRSYAVQRLAMEKGDRQMADQAARETQKNLEEANRFAALSTQQQNMYNLQKYKAREDAAAEAAKQRIQYGLGVEGLKLKREQLGAQATKYALQRGAARMKADAAAAKELADMLKNNMVEAAKMTPEQKEKWKKDRADELYRNYLSTMVSDLREEDEEGG